ncbi:MAG TPA: Ku protein [Solirubrobacteraceae bacterium]|jgi:DNA end-binding protein Ku|nr:Ku protein [Solirubrobacteraceae bacterium]
MAPRSIWNGAVAFGAVNVPIKVFGALEDKAIRFRELHVKDGSEVGHRLVGPDGEEVSRDRVVKGFDVGDEEYVVLSDDEIKAADQPARKAIELADFVPAEQIDPVFYGKPYHLAPQDGAEAAYALLVKALEKSGRVGVGRVSLRQREQLVSVRPVDGVLRMQVMRFADELVAADALDVDEPSKAPGKREVDMAGMLVETLAAAFDPDRYEDTYRERVLEVVRAKERGEEPDLAEPEEADSPDDLMAALEASLKAAKS